MARRRKIFGIFLGIAAIVAQPGVTSAVFEGSHLLVQLLFTPLLAGWSIWAASPSPCGRRTYEPPSSSLCSPAFPPFGIVALMSSNVVMPTHGRALGLAALLIVDLLGWRAVAPMFYRERLITGTRS